MPVMMMGERTASDFGAVRDSAVDSVRSSDRNAIACIRCAFAALVLTIVAYRIGGPGIGPRIAYAVIAGYLAYSIVYLLLGRPGLHARHARISYWVDLLIFTFLLFALKMHDSVLFALLLFPIIVASRLASARVGAVVAIVATGGYIATALPHAGLTQIESLEVTSRAACLLLLASVIIYWAVSEEEAGKKLKFLLRINEAWNPRLGMDKTVLANLGRLVKLYEADGAILVVKHAEDHAKWVMYSTTAAGAPKVSDITAETAAQLTSLRPDLSTAYSESPSWQDRLRSVAVSRESRATQRLCVAACQGLLNMLDTRNFATVPYMQRNGTTGRIFIVSDRVSFTRGHVRFLIQVSRVIALVIENMFLTEQVITKATDYERLQISRDMHDTTIQPYIGLKLALEALYRQARGTTLEDRITEIISMTATTISDLRSYTSQLRERTSMPGENLVAAVLKQAEVFSRFYGITVNVRDDIQAPINGQIAAELLQIISEGLSNILRHTSAKRADIVISSSRARIVLDIGNRKERVQREPAVAFTPRSISERAASLGGAATVQEIDHQYTLVRVDIPNNLNLET